MVDDDDDPTPPARDDRRVKDLVAAGSEAELDPATQADLARWFGLPSFQQVEATAPRPRVSRDPEQDARREAQARATAAVDPRFAEALHARGAAVADMTVFRAQDLRMLDPSISAVDPVLLARASAVSEPREVDMPLGLMQDLKECTPQALLRDLHRPELEFQLRLEVDAALEAAMPFDAVRQVREVMSARLLPPFPPTPFQQALIALEVLAGAKRDPWAEIRTPNRRVSE